MAETELRTTVYFSRATRRKLARIAKELHYSRSGFLAAAIDDQYKELFGDEPPPPTPDERDSA